MKDGRVRGRTDHALLLADNLPEILEDLVELGDPLFDLLNLSLALLNELLLEIDLAVDQLRSRLSPGKNGRGSESNTEGRRKRTYSSTSCSLLPAAAASLDEE